MQKYLKWILLVFIGMAGCSTRHEYRSMPEIAASPDAVNINTSSVDELERLPHIGRKTAENIIRFRDENGPFRRAEHLMQIRGISESRFVEIRQFVKVE